MSPDIALGILAAGMAGCAAALLLANASLRRTNARLQGLLDAITEEAKHAASRAYFDGAEATRTEDINLAIECIGQAPDHARNTIRHLAGFVASMKKLGARDKARRRTYEATAQDEKGRGSEAGPGTGAEAETGAGQREAAAGGRPIAGGAQGQEAGNGQADLLRGRRGGAAQEQPRGQLQRSHQGAAGQAERPAQ